MLFVAFAHIVLSSSSFCQLAPQLWLSTLQAIHINTKMWRWLKSYKCLNCDCAESVNAMKKLNWCEKVLIFVSVSQSEWGFYENVWRREKSWKMSGSEVISHRLPLELRCDKAPKKVEYFQMFSWDVKDEYSFECRQIVDISKFEWSFYLEAWMTTWALKRLEKVWKWEIAWKFSNLLEWEKMAKKHQIFLKLWMILISCQFPTEMNILDMNIWPHPLFPLNYI